MKTLAQAKNRTARATHSAAVAFVMMFLAALLGGCTYRTGMNEFPGVRSAGWFSYAAAQDIRTRCTPGHDTYRAIYNGNWQEQVRTYDFGPSATGQGGVLDQRVFAGGSGLTFSTTLTLPLNGDALDLARSVDAQTRLTEAEYRALVAALRADGLGEPGPADARLGSWQFWWAAAACIDGRFVYNAWIYPGTRFAALSFPAVLLQHDQTGVPVAQPRHTEQQAFRNLDAGREPQHSDFTIQLDGSGMPIRLPAF